jgi:aminoglycoside phosphotransferase (APT) family kinase protein
MSAVDPRDPHAVAAAVQAWASDRFGTAASMVGEPTSVAGGFDSYIHLVELRGEGLPAEWRAPIVVRVVPTADRAARAAGEAAVQGWCADQGYPAPRVLAVLAPGELLDLPVLVMERVPGVTMLEALKAKPWRARSFVDRLVELQLHLHELPTSGWPGSASADSLADIRLGLTRRAASELGDPALSRALELADALVASGATSGGDLVVCHGDFHPLNVMVDGDAAAVIDWTDAGLGPREADVARTVLLLNVAAVAADGRLERAALKVAGPRLAHRYRRGYERGEQLDEGRMASWDALHALHGWAQIEMLHAGGFAAESSSAGNESRVPLELAHWLRARVESSLG